MEKHMDTRKLVLYALFAALIFILGLTPLGFIYLPIAAITTVHIPVIVGSYVHGPKGGALLGGIFGLTSLIRCFSTPDATAAIVLGTGTGFGPYNLVLVLAIIFLPRVLTGLFSGLIYKGMAKTGKELLAMGTAAVAGSLTNTVFFLGGLYVLAFEQTAAAMGVQAMEIQLAHMLQGIVDSRHHAAHDDPLHRCGGDRQVMEKGLHPHPVFIRRTFLIRGQPPG